MSAHSKLDYRSAFCQATQTTLLDYRVGAIGGFHYIEISSYPGGIG